MQTQTPFAPTIPVKNGDKMDWYHLEGASVGLAIAQVLEKQQRPVLIVASDTLSATRLEYELRFFHSTGTILHFPDWETLPYDQFSPHQDIISERLATLTHIPHVQQGAIITSISTLLHRLAPTHYLSGNSFVLKQHDKFDLQTMRRQLDAANYRNVDQVREHGEFAVRGSIIDIFPMGSETPFRIDLFDDEIDSIRIFSVENQRSLEKAERIDLLPAHEFPLDEKSIELFRQQWRNTFSGNPLRCGMYQDITEGVCTPGIEYYLPLFFEKTGTLFDYLPDNTLIIQIGNVFQKAEENWLEIKSRYEQRRHDATQPILSPETVFIPTAEAFGHFKQYACIRVNPQTQNDNANAYTFETSTPPVFTVEHKSQQPLHQLETFLLQYEGRVLFCAETNGRREVLSQLFKQINLTPQHFSTWDEFLESSAPHGITVAALDEGLTLTSPLISVIAEAQLYGKRVMQRRRRKVSQQDTDTIVKDLTELQVNAPIVHLDHGIGRYLGLQTLTVGEMTTEFLCIEYADHAKLYVPVTSLHLISRYSGNDTDNAPINRLGTEQWQRAKRKAAEQVRDVAAELLDLYARREARKGKACEVRGEYDAFAATFPFEETPDQQQAIDQVVSDMLTDKPMDRLVCGDVGFGKTEVAMRASFLAVQNNKQVVVLVPTTLLAQQHWQNFQDRFADWPISIEMISRFRSAKDQAQVIERLEAGKVDIVIGTHKLLQESIKFKSLGLVIIDEEHRFGVRQKERLKALRSEVDILTLTATPIPRTLNMAFAGIRDLSIIATPPARRLAVKTFVHEHKDSIMQEALQREIMRGGQVYCLHNDVATIEKTARELEALVPEARACVAHGQMRERELEQIMSDFYHRRFNVLVCTTIIESGIDIPSANTIIIHRADKLGLAQLHQLRGRVGRSHHQAYAYLLTPPKKSMTSDAIKRLDAIASLEQLGVGFTLATHDLEIRGAGELLGEGQSGNMHAIGFSLYMDLLSRAVDALKEGKEPELDTVIHHGPEIDLQISALIPDRYLEDVHLRLQFYKRIASTQTQNELDDIQVEMIDRFGLLPDPLKNLFAIASLKQHVASLGIVKIEANSKGGKIEFCEKPNLDPMNILKLIQDKTGQYKLEGPTRLRFQLLPHENKDRIELIEKIIQRL